MYSEEDLKHLMYVFQKDADVANAKAEEYQRKFEHCRAECKKRKTGKKWKTGKPKKYGRYLVTRTIFGKYTIVDIVGYGKMDDLEETKKVCWYDHDSDYGDYEVDNVIAWMELPEPFEKKEAEDER